MSWKFRKKQGCWNSVPLCLACLHWLSYERVKCKEKVKKTGKRFNFGIFGAKESGNPFAACPAGDADRTERLWLFFHQRYFTFACESKRLWRQFGRLLSFCHRIHQMNRSFLLRLHVRWIWKCRTAWRRSGRSPGPRWCIRPDHRPVLRYLYRNTPLPILSSSMYMSGEPGICSGPGTLGKEGANMNSVIFMVNFLLRFCL